MTRPSNRTTRLVAVLVACGVLTACAGRRKGTLEEEVTLRSLAGRSVVVAEDPGIKATEEQAISAYKRFLELAQDAPQAAVGKTPMV